MTLISVHCTKLEYVGGCTAVGVGGRRGF